MFKNQTMVTTIEWWIISSVWIMVWGQTAWDPTANYTFNSWSMFMCRTWSVLTYLHTLSPSKTMQHSISLGLKQKKTCQIPFWCKGRVFRVWTSGMSSFWWFIPDCLWSLSTLMNPSLYSPFSWICHGYVMDMSWILLIYHDIYIISYNTILYIYHDKFPIFLNSPTVHTTNACKTQRCPGILEYVRDFRRERGAWLRSTQLPRLFFTLF